MFKFLYKWLFCSWAHYKHRCYPTVWSEEIAIEHNLLPYKPNYWHCHKCHKCYEGFEDLFEDPKNE